MLLLGESNMNYFKASEKWSRSKGFAIQPEKQFGQRHQLFVVYTDIEFRVISQLIILCWHEGVMYHGGFFGVTDQIRLQDKLGSLAAVLAGHRLPVKANYFSWWAAERKKKLDQTEALSGPPPDNGVYAPVQRLIALLHYEKVTGNVVAIDQLGGCLALWVEVNRFR